MTLDEARFKVISAVISMSDDYEDTFISYENYLKENNLDDIVFYNIVKYQLTREKQYLLIAKQNLLGDITIDNFTNFTISEKQLDILLEEVEFDLKNNMHRISKPEEYDYYHKILNSVEAYALKSYDKFHATYFFIRVYKISKLVWSKHELLNNYNRYEYLYSLLKENRFDYYGYKLNLDLINLADYGLRFSDDQTTNWKALIKKYKADETALIHLLKLHPVFSTKSMLFWLYYIDNSSSKYIMEDILGTKLEVSEDIDIYQYYNKEIIKKSYEEIELMKDNESLLKSKLSLIQKMISFNLNHYDLTYLLSYLDLEAKLYLAIDTLKSSSKEGNASHKYANRLAKIDLIKNYIR